MSKIINLEDFKKSKNKKELDKNKPFESEYIKAFKKMTPEEIRMVEELLEN